MNVTTPVRFKDEKGNVIEAQLVSPVTLPTKFWALLPAPDGKQYSAFPTGVLDFPGVAPPMFSAVPNVPAQAPPVSLNMTVYVSGAYDTLSIASLPSGWTFDGSTLTGAINAVAGAVKLQANRSDIQPVLSNSFTLPSLAATISLSADVHAPAVPLSLAISLTSGNQPQIMFDASSDPFDHAGETWAGLSGYLIDKGASLSYAAITAPGTGVQFVTAGADIGSPAVAGSSSVSGSSWTFSAGGLDFGTFNGTGIADQGHFRGMQVTGDFQLTGKISAASWPQPFSKIGVHCRATLDPASPNVGAYACNPTAGASNLQVGVRATAGAVATTPAVLTVAFTLPLWIRLKRVGNVFTMSTSEDGISFPALPSQTVILPAQCYWGFAGSAHAATGSMTATVDQVCATQDPPLVYIDSAVAQSGSAQTLSYAVRAVDLAGNASTALKTLVVVVPAGTTISADGTTIPSATQIIDNNLDVWTVSAGVALKNGVATPSANVILLLKFGGAIYQENSANNWWIWNTTAWVATSDPRVQTGVPTLAQNAGYLTKVFDSTQISNAAGGWFNNPKIFGQQATGQSVQNSDGTLTINGSAGNSAIVQLCTIAVDTTKPRNFVGMAFGPCYMKCVMSVTNPAGLSTFWPAFWSNDVETMAFNAATAFNHWAGQATGYSEGIEVDFMELDQHNATGGACQMHDYYGIFGSQSDKTLYTSGNLANLDWSQPVTIEVLWIPATASSQGSMQIFYNGTQVGATIHWNLYSAASTPPPVAGTTAGAVLDTRHLAPIFQTNPACPIVLHSYQVWQKNGTVNLVDSANSTVGGSISGGGTFGVAVDTSNGNLINLLDGTQLLPIFAACNAMETMEGGGARAAGFANVTAGQLTAAVNASYNSLSTAAKPYGEINGIRLPVCSFPALGLSGVDPGFGDIPGNYTSLGGGLFTSKISSANYLAAIDNMVAQCKIAGLYLLLDLHWGTPVIAGKNVCPMGQPAMLSTQDLIFWQQMAARYKNMPWVMFESFNEPFDDHVFNDANSGAGIARLGNAGTFNLSPFLMKDNTNGDIETAIATGSTGACVGHQAVINIVRGQSAPNVIFASPPWYAGEIESWLSMGLTDPLNQLGASFHGYGYNKGIGNFDNVKAAKRAVLCTELGTLFNIPSTYVQFRSRGYGYTWWGQWNNYGASSNPGAAWANLRPWTGNGQTAPTGSN